MPLRCSLTTLEVLSSAKLRLLLTIKKCSVNMVSVAKSALQHPFG